MVYIKYTTQSCRKEEKKNMSTSHTAIISINYTTKIFISVELIFSLVEPQDSACGSQHRRIHFFYIPMMSKHYLLYLIKSS